MKVCYVDESGNNGADPCLVMVGILADVTRLNRTVAEFGEIFGLVESLFEENLRELKGAKMIFGRDRWKKIDADTRKRLAGTICKWVGDRKHHLVMAAIDRATFGRAPDPGLPKRDPWLAAALHIALQVQKNNQEHAKNKGRTFLIFDENKAGADHLSELLWAPPAWTDDYYARGKKQAALDQLIDSSFSVKSHHAGLVQVADLYAFVFRRWAEINQYGQAEEWTGERAYIDELVAMLRPRLVSGSVRHPKKAPPDSAKWFTSVTPACIAGL